VSKTSKHWSNEKGPSSTTKIVQQNNSERSNAYGYKYFYLLLFYPFVVPAGLSQQAKTAAGDALKLTKKCGKFKSEHFLPPRKKLRDSKVGVLRASHKIFNSEVRNCWNNASKFSSISSSQLT
jgi:hypothetical protein